MTDKIALITGASRGLGAALAESLSASHHVIAVARTIGALEELDDRIIASGGQASLAPMDITNPEAMAQLCRSLYDRWGKIDLWVHAAVHAAPLSPASTIDRKDFAKSLAVNVTATATLIPFIAPLLGEDGTAVFFDDPEAKGKFFGAYGATKAAQIALAQSWQAEALKVGPAIKIVTPKPMSTATRARFYPGENRSGLNDPKGEAKRLLAEILGPTPSSTRL
ncbi:MAG: SDR family oxidoreductase [Marinovum sp.]|jgi:NAD(P)-dependent dehydrogenase (short-subunit alcohol dehydrogenase family)|nr:SDR family oxidoreductase [Marinovum sp.]